MHAKQTTGIATINQRVLAAFPLMVPPLHEQERVVAALDDVRQEAERVRRAVRIWYYDLSGVKVGKKSPLTLAHFEEFFRLLATRGDSERSWTVERKEIEARGYDLKAVNPNARRDEDQRTPEELLDLIEAKGRGCRGACHPPRAELERDDRRHRFPRKISLRFPQPVKPRVSLPNWPSSACHCRRGDHHELDPGAPGERYQVVVHVDAPALADPDQPGQSVLEGGAHVPAETSRRLACDASRVVMRHDPDGRVVEIGARTRTIPPALRRALHHRDRGCRFPGCGLPLGEGHHVRHWAHGGPTTLSNLALLCRRHHRAIHEEGYQVDRQPDGALRFRRPDGRLLPEVPPPVTVPADPDTALRARHAAQGLCLHARTTCPGWLGERLDVGWVIDVLHPLARRGVNASRRE